MIASQHNIIVLTAYSTNCEQCQSVEYVLPTVN